MPELNAIAREYGALVIEDACQAHGARIETPEGWIRAGAVSSAGAFSFYPGKNLGGWGEGGAVAVNDDELKARIVSLRDHGRISHYAHQEIGYNARLDAIQSAVLRAKLEKLDEWNGRRRKLAKAYCERLEGCGVKLPVEPEGYESVYHLFVIRTDKRDAIRQALMEKNIGCGIHYPLPLHLQPACRYLGYKSGDFPAAERIGDTVLSLPMHPALTISRSRSGGRDGSGNHEEGIKSVRRRAQHRDCCVRTPPHMWWLKHVRRRTSKTERRSSRPLMASRYSTAFSVALAIHDPAHAQEIRLLGTDSRLLFLGVAAVVAVWILVFRACDLYRMRAGGMKETAAVVRGCTYAAMLSLIAGFLVHFDGSRLTIGLAYVFSIPAVLLGRALARNLVRRIYSNPRITIPLASSDSTMSAATCSIRSPAR